MGNCLDAMPDTSVDLLLAQIRKALADADEFVGDAQSAVAVLEPVLNREMVSVNMSDKRPNKKQKKQIQKVTAETIAKLGVARAAAGKPVVDGE